MNDTTQTTTQSRARPSSLDALSRTIDSLESRIERLVANQRGKQQAGQRPAPQHAPRDEGPGDAVHHEIAERQRMLDRERTNLEARLATRRTAAPLDAGTDKTLRDIAESLVSLREELKSDIAEGLTREIAGLREEIGDMKGDGGQPLPPMMREELVRLADCIERLGANGPQAGNEALAQEVQSFRATLERLTDESAERLGVVEQCLSAIDPQTMRDEIAAMAARVEDLHASLADVKDPASGNDIEQHLKSVTSALATLAEQVNLDEAAIDHRFTELGGRLDEISKAIVSVGARSDRTEDGAALARIEERLEGLIHQMDSTNLEAMEGLTTRVSVLMESVNSLASEESVSALGDRLDQLSAMLEQAGPQRDDTNLAVRLMEISDKIDLLGEGAVSDALAGRLDALARRIDDAAEMTTSANQSLVERIEKLMWQSDSPSTDMESLDERLTEIARRLDETRAAPADQAILQNLEAQIANLSDLLARPGAAASLEEAAIHSRLATVEEHLETNDEYIIEAARQAAEAVVAAYGRHAADDDADPGELAAISQLAEDLRALEQLNQQSDERTARAFDAVHDTLVKIAGHLEHLGNAYDRLPAEADDDEAPVAARDDEDEDIAAIFGRRETVAEAPVQTDVRAEQAGEDAEEERSTATALLVDPTRDTSALAAEAEVAQDRTDHRNEGAPRKRGLLSGIGGRFRRREGKAADQNADETATSARPDLEDAPALDPSDTMESEGVGLPVPVSSNEPLEPGSGAPDIERILSRVDENGVRSADFENGDFIAAARRAAQAAAAEAETEDAAGSGKSGGLKGILKARRRPILLAVGAILLVVMSWPLASTLIKRHDRVVAAKAPADQVAERSVPKVSDEKTGATAGGDAVLPKVTALADAPSDDPADAVAADPKLGASGQAPGNSNAGPDDTASAGTQASTAASQATAAGKDAGAKPAAAARNPAVQDEAQAQKPTAAAASAPASQAAASSSARSMDAIASQPTGSASATPVAAVAEKAGTAPAAGEQVASSAVPAVPEAIGPQSLRQAAQNGDGKALYEIGARYTDGRGVGIDLKEAATWYRAAAERGLAPAQYRLANFYEKGQGVDRDPELARRWYRKAADQGNVSAMHNLAVLDAMGRAGKPDFAAASGWFRKAADRGVKDSQYNLAILYAQGHGVPRDLGESYKWFALAAQGGDSDAQHKRDQVAAAMSKDDLARARAAVGDWKAKPVDPAANTVDVPKTWSGKDTTTASVDMTRAVRNIQVILDNNGFDAGKPDGIMGAKTRGAIKAFQTSVGQQPTGEVTDELIKELLARNKKQQKNS